MAGESAVNRAAMQTAAGQVDDAVSQVRAQQSRLAGYHGDLMGGWQGDAATAFTNAYNSFNADFTTVINALQTIQEKLVTSRAHYQATEEQQTAAANRVQSQINR
jgi:WXG100 family type VII secretion target